jgi:hypothetical protein
MSDSVDDVQPPKPVGEQASGADRSTADDSSKGAPTPEKKRGAGRRWLIVGLVVAGLAGALLVGYAIGGSSRDDDLSSAEAQAAQANKAADSANEDAAASKEALEQDQAQDEEAVRKVSQGLEDLGNAVQQEEAKDDQAANDAVDQAANDIRGGLEQIGANVSEKLDKALADLSGKINDAVGSQSSGNAQGNGG